MRNVMIILMGLAFAGCSTPQVYETTTKPPKVVLMQCNQVGSKMMCRRIIQNDGE